MWSTVGSSANPAFIGRPRQFRFLVAVSADLFPSEALARIPIDTLRIHNCGMDALLVFRSGRNAVPSPIALDVCSRLSVKPAPVLNSRDSADEKFRKLVVGHRDDTLGLSHYYDVYVAGTMPFRL